MPSMKFLEKTKFEKQPLSLNEYAEYSIDQAYSAFRFIYYFNELEEADSFEVAIEQNYHKIFFSDITRLPEGKYKLVLVSGISTARIN